MGETFTKAYPRPGGARAAVDHYRWLASLGAPVPELLEATSGQLIFTHMGGSHCRISDIPAVAALLGNLLVTRADARREVFSYIEGFYNPWRRHSANGQLSPAEYERHHIEAPQERPAVLPQVA